MTATANRTIGRGVGRGSRALGAGLAAAISLFAAVVLAGAAEASGQSSLGGVLGLSALGAAIGVPVGAVLGWIHMPAAVSSHGSRRLVLVARLATLAVLLGAAVLSTALALGGLFVAGADVASLGDAAASFAMLFSLGLIIFGLPAWALAAAVCASWVMLVGAAGNEQPGDAHAVASDRR